MSLFRAFISFLLAIIVLFAVGTGMAEEASEAAPEQIRTLIPADEHMALLAVLFTAVAIAIWLEHRYKWAAKVSGAVIALIIAILLVNLRVIPTSAKVFDTVVWDYAVPLAIPLLMLQTNIRKIRKETGRFLLIFLIGSAGTIAGTMLGTLFLKKAVDGLPGIAAMMTGSYIGGGVNFSALSKTFEVKEGLIAAATVADNLNMAVYFLVLVGIAGSAFFRKRYSHPHIDEILAGGKSREGRTMASQYWTRKDISLKDIAINLAYAAVVVLASRLIGGFFKSIIPENGELLKVLRTFFGSEYVWITNISVLVASFLPKQAREMHGAQEIGTWMIYLFFFVIGVPASIPELVSNAPVLLVFCMFAVLMNMAFCFIGGKLLKFDLEDIILASNANIGGPTTAAGMAIAQGWTKLIGPCMLVGTFGYVIGTWLGTLVGSILGA